MHNLMHYLSIVDFSQGIFLWQVFLRLRFPVAEYFYSLICGVFFLVDSIE